MRGKYGCYMGIWDIKITLPVEHGHQYYTDSQIDLIIEEFISWFIKSTEKYIYFSICQVVKNTGEN